jgi:hypothetical protein
MIFLRSISAFGFSTVSMVHLGTGPLVLAAQPLPPIRVEALPFSASEADILAVCRSAAGELVRHFPQSHPLEPIVIRKGDAGPLVAFRRNEQDEIVVFLDTGKNFWSQYAYQFAHEFCHILCRFHRDNPHLWFEEILCETASLYALRAMAASWKEQAPFPNWRSYSDSLRSYADDLIASRELLQVLARDGLAAFYRSNHESLAKNPTDRETNGAIAVFLLPLFERNPSSWEALLSLRTEPAAADFQTHLSQWHDQAPDRHKPFINSIISLFGLTLHIKAD